MRTLLERVKGILFAPAAEWVAIAREAADASALFTRYVAILALIPALARFIGWSVIGGYTPVLTGLADSLAGYVLSFVAVYLVAVIVNAFAPRYGAQRNFGNALKLTVYAYTPAWLAGIFLLLPGLSFLTILSLYGVYLLWLGLPPLMRVPPERALPYTAAVGTCAVVLAVVLGIAQIALFGLPR